MELRQLSALLLAISLVAVPSVRAEDPAGDVEVDWTAEALVGEGTDGTAVVQEKEEAVIQKKGGQRGKVKRAKREKKVKSPEKGKTKKSKSATSKRGKKDKKKVAKKRGKTEVDKIGKYDKKGDIKSFRKATKGLIDYMNDVKDGSKTATALEKPALYRAIAKISWVSGRTRFGTKAHIEAAIELLSNASDHPELFTVSKMKMINKWLNEKREQLKNFGKKDMKKKDVSKRKKVKKTEKSSAYDKMQQKRAATRKERN